MTLKEIRPYLFLLVISLYYLNDFLFIKFQSDYYTLISIDYFTRIITLFVLVLVGLRFKKISPRQLELDETIKWTFGMFFIGLLVYTIVVPILSKVTMSTGFYKFPKYPNIPVKLIDITFGLALVAVSEEILFRGIMITWLKKHMYKPSRIAFISSAAFGAIHWGSGIPHVIGAFLFGLLPAFFYLKKRNLVPCILAHYFLNLFIFSL